MRVSEERLVKWARRKNLNRLHNVLRHHNPDFRKQAVIHIGLIKDTVSIPFLKALVDDPEEEVIRHAAHALESIDPENNYLAILLEEAEKRMLLEQGWTEASTPKSRFKRSARDEYLPTDVDGTPMKSSQEILDSRARQHAGMQMFITIISLIGLAGIFYLIYLKTGPPDWDYLFG